MGDYPNIKYKSIKSVLPDDLTGKSVLDIGCNAGFYSMEMKLRGAKRVVGTDSDPRYLAQAKFAAEVNGLDIEYRDLSVYDVAKLQEKFDLVIFMGRPLPPAAPAFGLRSDSPDEYVAGDLLLFQSMQRGSSDSANLKEDYDFWETQIFDQPEYPKMFFVENRYSHDPTNWWIPNLACSEAMLRSSGFEVVEHPEEEVFLCRRIELAPAPDGPRAVHPALGGSQ